MSLRSLIPRLLTCLAIAAAFNLLLAWSFAAFSSPRLTSRWWNFTFRGVDWSIRAHSGPGLFFWTSEATTGLRTAKIRDISIDDLRSADLFGQCPARTQDILAHPNTAPPFWTDFAFGWPMPSMRFAREQARFSFVLGPAGSLALIPENQIAAKPIPAVPFPPPITHGGLAITATITLPYFPMWSGSLINTGFYALLLALALAAARRLRRLFRIARNHCPACAYSRAGLAPETPCPECGHITPPS